MFILGIDDAGRGPLIGPMILAGVLLSYEQEKYLKNFEIRDSKVVSQTKRVELASIIRKNSSKIKIVEVFPNEIDFSIEMGINLNILEAKKTAEIINTINEKEIRKEKIKVIVDCPSNNIEAWCKTLLGFVSFKENLEVICEHKADANHLSVAAASILAKVKREEKICEIKKQFEKYGDVGSGYPSDPVTRKFLIKNGKILSESGIFRKSWSTWKEVFPEKGQSKLTDYN